jgi:hypothetical protein
MTVIAWSCTRFRWRYQFDEMCHILAGEVFITDESGGARRLGPRQHRRLARDGRHPQDHGLPRRGA